MSTDKILSPLVSSLFLKMQSFTTMPIDNVAIATAKAEKLVGSKRYPKQEAPRTPKGYSIVSMNNNHTKIGVIFFTSHSFPSIFALCAAFYLPTSLGCNQIKFSKCILVRRQKNIRAILKFKAYSSSSYLSFLRHEGQIISSLFTSSSERYIFSPHSGHSNS